jgi:predicted outer membrane repeat protein
MAAFCCAPASLPRRRLFRPRWLAALLCAALLPRAHATCSYTLTLPDAVTGEGDAGACAPYARSSLVDGVAAVCGPISVPPGATLAVGTCALPGAACTGATAIALNDAVLGSQLLNVSSVALDSAVAALSQGCVLGGSCSYAEWANPRLSTAGVEVAASCYGHSACTAVAAYRITLGAGLAPSSTPALTFSVTATSAATLTGLAGAAPAGAAVSIWGRTASSPFVSGALASASGGWTSLWSGSWSAGGVTFTTPLALAAGDVGGLLVSASSATDALACAHALGTPDAQLLADGALTLSQGGALAGAFTGGVVTSSCAWAGLSLTYSLASACAASPPPPMPDIVTSSPNTMVASLADLLNALANPAVAIIEVDADIVLNGTQLAIALDPVTHTRTLLIEGTNACIRRSRATPLCSLSGSGVSRVLEVIDGVQLWMGRLLLRDGVAPDGEDGGCVLFGCAACSLTLEAVHMRNCSAPRGGGGALAATGGAALVATELLVQGNTAAVGGGLLIRGGALQINGSTFTDNVATASSTDVDIGAFDLLGPAGGGMALEAVTGSLSGCAFSNNTATTTDFVLVDNPDVPQARGGGLFVADCTMALDAVTFTGNKASFGGGIYVDESFLTLASCALVGNLATLGAGGGLFAADDGQLTLEDTLVTGNAAGGIMGGGMAVFNMSVRVVRSVLTANHCPAGCGGGLGLHAGATVLTEGGTVVSGNSALSGGGLCCMRCANMTTADAFLFDNRALTGSGGALYSAHTPTTLINSSLNGNSAPAGGAVAAVSAKLHVHDCALHDNTALSSHGGAIFHDASDDALAELVVMNTTFANHTCMAGGGAVAAFSSSAAAFSACTFVNNSIAAFAATGGAVMALNVASLRVEMCTFTSNWVELLPELSDDAALGFIDSLAAPGSGSGGAIWIGSDGVTSADVLDTLFESNSASTGGAMRVTGGVAFTMRRSELLHNRVSGDSDEGPRGGAIITDLEAVSEILDTSFIGCEAVRGGAGWHGVTTQTTYRNCTFIENVAYAGEDTKGSAVYVGEESSVLVSGCAFLHNRAEGGGAGTIALEGEDASRLRVEDSLFDENWALLGAGIFVVRRAQQVAAHSRPGRSTHPMCSLPAHRRERPLRLCSSASATQHSQTTPQPLALCSSLSHLILSVSTACRRCATLKATPLWTTAPSTQRLRSTSSSRCQHACAAGPRCPFPCHWWTGAAAQACHTGVAWC